jgi:hypothetical protein
MHSEVEETWRTSDVDDAVLTHLVTCGLRYQPMR